LFYPGNREQDAKIRESRMCKMSAKNARLMSDEPDSRVLAKEGLVGGEPCEQQILRAYGLGIDCHSRFIAVCVLKREGESVIRFEKEFGVSWRELLDACSWACAKAGCAPRSVRYCIESTGTYHMPALRARKGEPSVVNPLLAGPTRRKTDVLDAPASAIGLKGAQAACLPKGLHTAQDVCNADFGGQLGGVRGVGESTMRAIHEWAKRNRLIEPKEVHHAKERRKNRAGPLSARRGDGPEAPGGEDRRGGRKVPHPPVREDQRGSDAGGQVCRQPAPGRDPGRGGRR
jgi:hypothetical protein